MSASTSLFSQNPSHDYVTEVVELTETTGNQGGRGYGTVSGQTFEVGTGDIPLTQSLGAVYQIDIYEIAEHTTDGRTVHQLRGPVYSSTSTVLSGISGNDQSKLGVSGFIVFLLVFINTLLGV
ncbi:uncharacterized protein KGF55_001675 [Candida pseudojiufengensis]|uniref:uncharacterized protein n=1 Tax=Candida pseudojiufengensis TaxID=497109 RepID=UPI0022252F96|nr:uncharacterized protein KGF55_001675 [Candida pseudojiufengensis]KAI5964606.1 hypothetical protein KGF55_001675 [Candida pseudojiufengensis]